MRFVFVGTGTLSVLTARMLIERGHEVVMIERDSETVDRLAEEVDCGFLRGDASRPAILREADPESTDLLFCLARDDQSNILTSLVAKSLGFREVITKIEDPELEHLCAELGLAASLVPMHMVGRYLADMAEGQNIIELSDIFRGDARIFSFRLTSADAGRVAELDLPSEASVICFYRNGDFHIAGNDSVLHDGDDVVVLTTMRNLRALRKRFGGSL